MPNKLQKKREKPYLAPRRRPSWPRPTSHLVVYLPRAPKVLAVMHALAADAVLPPPARHESPLSSTRRHEKPLDAPHSLSPSRTFLSRSCDDLDGDPSAAVAMG